MPSNPTPTPDLELTAQSYRPASPDSSGSRAVGTQDRVVYVDVLRGVAVMGILLVNILGFGLPWAAYNNPSAYGGDTGLNLAYWFAQLVLIDGKMRGIFSMLFGASVILMTRRGEARGLGIGVADLYYRRT